MVGATRGVRIAAIILAGGFLASRVLGLVRNMALGAAFGTGPDLDAYFAAFRIPDLIFQLLAGAAMGSAFVPTFAAYLTQGRDDEAWTVASSVLNLVFGAALAVAVLAFVAAPALVPWMVPGFSPEYQRLTVDLTRVMLLSPVFFCASGILTGILNARHHYLLPAVAPLLYNLAIIVGAIGLAGPLGVFGPAWGVVVGSALHLAVQLPGLRWHGMVYRLRADLRHPGVRQVARLTGPRVLGLAATHGNFVVITVLASQLEVGSLGALTYAWALMMVPLGVFGMSFATALFPTLAEMAAEDSRERLRDALALGTRLMLFLNIPAGLGLAVLGEPIVAALFQRGLFHAEATRATALAVGSLGLGLFAYAGLEVITRGFYALHDTVTPLLFAALALLLNLGFGLALMGPLGHTGLALGLSLSTAVEFLGLYLALRRRLGGLQGREVLAAAGRALGAAALMVLALVGLRALAPLLGMDGHTQAATVVLSGVPLGAAVFLGAAWLLGAPEARLLAARLRLRKAA